MWGISTNLFVYALCLPVRAILYGGSRLPFRTPRDKITPNATQIAQTTVSPMYRAHSESEMKII